VSTVEEVAALLSEGLAEISHSSRKWRVTGAAAAAEPITKHTVMVWIDSAQRHPTMGFPHVQYEMSVVVAVATENPSKVEAVLELALGEVIAALQPHEHLVWSEATRVTLEGANAPGFQLKVTCVAKIQGA